jgi:hypothetical protein
VKHHPLCPVATKSCCPWMGECDCQCMCDFINKVITHCADVVNHQHLVASSGSRDFCFGWDRAVEHVRTKVLESQAK